MSRKALLELSEEFVDTSLRLDPVLATLVGVHDYDQELGDPSLGAVRRRIEWLKNMKQRLEREVNESKLAPAERVDSRLLRSRLAAGIVIWETQREAERNPILYPDNCLYGLFLLFAREFAPLSERLDALLERLDRTGAYLAQAQETLTESPRIFAEVAREVALSGAEFVSELRASLARELPEQMLRIQAACDGAKKAFEDYAQWTERELATRAQPPFAIGRAAFDARLAEEHLLPYDTESLEKLGWKILRETQDEMTRLAAEIAPRKSWHDLIGEAKDRHPSPDGLLDAYRESMRRVRGFVVDKRLAPFPDGEELEIIETPAFDRSRIPYAAYLMPGPFDPEQKGFFYVTPVDRTMSRRDQEEQLRGHNLPSLPLVSLHEAYPGHHLQACWANRSSSRLRKLCDSPVLAEGWALYCEEMMYEQGFYEDPVVRLYQLKDLCWRAARVVVDCRLHSGEMGFDEAVDFLVSEPMLERPNAVAEVKRYTTTPTQPMSYVVGKSLLLELREEVRARLGDRFQLHDFHSAVLQAGTLPVPLVRLDVLDRLGIPAA